MSTFILVYPLLIMRRIYWILRHKVRMWYIEQKKKRVDMSVVYPPVVAHPLIKSGANTAMIPQPAMPVSKNARILPKNIFDNGGVQKYNLDSLIYGFRELCNWERENHYESLVNTFYEYSGGTGYYVVEGDQIHYYFKFYDSTMQYQTVIKLSISDLYHYFLKASYKNYEFRKYAVVARELAREQNSLILKCVISPGTGVVFRER